MSASLEDRVGPRPQLLLTYDFPPLGGGIARWMGELARRYPPGALVVSTGQTLGSEATDPALPNPVDRIAVPSRRLRTGPGLVRWSRRAVKLARQYQVDFTWCGNIRPAAYPARWVLARTGTPYGVFVHGGDLLALQARAAHSKLKRRAARALLGSASVLVANSQWTRDLASQTVADLGLSFAPDQFRVVPLGADPDLFRPGLPVERVRSHYALPPGRWLITVARLVPHKGADTVLHALAILAPEFADLRYAVVGQGEHRAELETLARGLQIEDRVRFLADVPDRDLPGLYNLADLYVGMSRRMGRDVEGFGISLVEASACGLPVVARRSGGIADAVRDGETGVLLDSSNPEPLAATLRALLLDEPRRRALGRAGRHAVETYFNWDRVVRDLRAISREFGSVAKAGPP